MSRASGDENAFHLIPPFPSPAWRGQELGQRPPIDTFTLRRNPQPAKRTPPLAREHSARRGDGER